MARPAPWLPRALCVLAISRATVAVAWCGWVPDVCLVVVRTSVDARGCPTPSAGVARATLHARLELGADDVVLLTVGRLVVRKGMRWFVDEVMPVLPSTVHYVVAGSGPESETIARGGGRAWARTARWHLLGLVADAVKREVLLRGADVFVQPNVPTSGDMEGFGLVLVEAAKRGTPVVASALEGMPDAVADGETGILCRAGDADEWLRRTGAPRPGPGGGGRGRRSLRRADTPVLFRDRRVQTSAGVRAGSRRDATGVTRPL